MENSVSNDAASAENKPQRASKVVFSGQGGEFFGIWIVNLLLSIVTLGIYSAWATVRTRQYFYGHTQIEKQPFRYLASPMQILKGRIIAIVIFALFFAISYLSPVMAVVLAILFMFVSPWLVVQSLKFNLRMTSYRNVRFAFHGDYLGAFKYFILLPILSVFTLYLALPWALKKIDHYICSNTSFGGKKMQVTTDTSSYYIAALVAAAIVFGVMTVVAIIGVVLGILMAVTDSGNASAAALMTSVAVFVAYFFAFTLSGAIYHCMIRNHLFERTELPGIAKFKSKMEVLPFLMLTLTNLVAIVLTLGLAYPWAKVRKARYLASVTSLIIYPQIDTLVDEQQSENSAFGEEAAGLFDVDVSIA
ncbi:YjgN family protein [Rheinheimera baltica]|uniref:YjgN family protein n=1 Tax=Rheinheimera baltica TaxID=67576 RepID=A0ABT9HZU0_9GAMM|nr:YjgN family protein [Rheinheimera baltica]MDP5136633.1 YjgN family protein [Rheinheimera baltica]MDP5142467.1 YjgN family protein [Rheinheimera baltica]MDP5150340.1 YjgN family protein [Rheinheimera baltica]